MARGPVSLAGMPWGSNTVRRKDSSFRPGCALRLSFALRYSWRSAAHNTPGEHPKACHTPNVLSGRQILTSEMPLLAPGLHTEAFLEHNSMIKSLVLCHRIELVRVHIAICLGLH